MKISITYLLFDYDFNTIEMPILTLVSQSHYGSYSGEENVKGTPWIIIFSMDQKTYLLRYYFFYEMVNRTGCIVL